jgi:hypothetical protein
MDKNVRIGNPSIEFDPIRQLCVLSDGTVTLDSILFKESVAGTAILNKEIRIIIPSGAPFEWSNAGTVISSLTGKVGTSSIKSSTELEINVTSDFGSSDILTIQNTQITMTGEKNDILLKAQATTDSNDDASMPATHYIRIGQPRIYSTGTHVFLVGDSSTFITENIIIKDSDTAPIINPDKNIIIEIPSAITLDWDSAIESNPSTISLSSNISSTNLNNLSYDVSNDKKYLTVNISEDLTAGDSPVRLTGTSTST